MEDIVKLTIKPVEKVSVIVFVKCRITQYKVLPDSMLWLQEVASHRDVFVSNTPWFCSTCEKCNVVVCKIHHLM